MRNHVRRHAPFVGRFVPAGRRDGYGWNVVLALACAYTLWLVGWYWETVESMVSIWYRSDTFVHGFLVFPISAWLVWRQRHELAVIEPAPATSRMPIVALALACVAWIIADFGDVIALRQFAWISMLVAGIWWLVGDTAARRLAFPLAFLYFAVPVGEFLVPTLIVWTADFTVAALRASGVPVLRDGMTFQIPTGAWSVVEACSGLRYLIASITVGVLYGYLTYRSAARRALFVLASLVVPIVANWLRAYMIVMIGHLSNNRLAVGVDHLIYGWLFFGIVMLLLFWVGSFWRQDDDSASKAPMQQMPVRATSSRVAAALHGGYGFAIIMALVAAAPVIAWVSPGNGAYPAIDRSPPAIEGWRIVEGPLLDWRPEFTPSRADITATYRRGEEAAGLFVAVYYDQDRESKVVSSENQLLRTTNRSGYVASEHLRTIDAGDAELEFTESVIRIQNQRLLARSWYWIDGTSTASPIRAKLAQMLARLRGAGDAGAIIVVYTVLPADGKAASPAFDDLTRAAWTTLPHTLARRLSPEGAP